MLCEPSFMQRACAAARCKLDSDLNICYYTV